MFVLLLQTACASSPAESAKGASARAADDPAEATSGADARLSPDAPELIRLDLDGALPVLGSPGADRDALFASNLNVGIDDDLLQYQATYELQPGDILAIGDPDSGMTSAPTTFAGQRLGQNVTLQLPELAGAPLSVGVSTEIRNNWLISGYTQSQHERANLNWAPGSATVNVQWAGAPTTFDSAVALTCDLESTIRLPTHEAGHHSEALQVSGRNCVVAAEDTPYAGIEAQTWGLGYVWSRERQQSEAVLSVIDPAWTQGLNEFQDIEPSYELGLSHRRDFGRLSAEALVSVRQSSILENAGPADVSSDIVSTTATDWAANASLTWQLPDASLSANWAQGVDRLWFAPEAGQRSDRFGLALNLTRWMETLVPEASPQLAMKWNWSQVRLPGEEATGNNAVRLDVALLF